MAEGVPYDLYERLLLLQVREIILECTLELSTKTSMYATLVGKPSWLLAWVCTEALRMVMSRSAAMQ